MMLRWLSAVGRHSPAVLILGMGVVALLPGVSALLRPFLPLLVSLVLGLGIARLDVGQVLRDFVELRKAARLVSIVMLFLPITCLALVAVGRLLGLAEDAVLVLLVFGAAPPLSSAASLALLMGYNARITLQVGLLATVALPLIGPLCFALAGVDARIDLIAMAVRIAVMIAGGFAIGLGLQRILGKPWIEANAMAFNGAVALSMLLFLFPLLDGVLAYVLAAPLRSAALLVLAVILNIGGNLATRLAARAVSDDRTADALGLMFGNRNVSFYLAVLPFNPVLSVFVAAAQVPIYATPALFRRKPSRLVE